MDTTYLANRQRQTATLNYEIYQHVGIEAKDEASKDF